MGGSDTPPFNGVQPTTIATGSDGATTWFVQTFTVPTDGTYQIGFADYNWSDQAVNPVAFFANATGTVSGGPIVGVVASGSNIDTSQPFYAASGLGTTISPVPRGLVRSPCPPYRFPAMRPALASGSTWPCRPWSAVWLLSGGVGA